MAANEVHVGDIGTVFRLTIYDDTTLANLSGATTKQILFSKPSGMLLTKTAVFTTDGTDGKIQYVTVAGDLDEAGQWTIQGYLVLSTWTGHTDKHHLSVYANVPLR